VGVISYFVPGRSWNNLEAIKDIKCPILFIHGQDDTLIPSNHSQTLHDACSHIEGKKLILLRHEDHNSMSETTLLKYITPFMQQQYKLIDPNLPLPVVEIDRRLREQPTNTSANTSSGSIWSSLTSMSRASTAATMSAIQTISNRQPKESNDKA
jgi:fermentation-respiration switch protein FrsA (DUF1100 family)